MVLASTFLEISAQVAGHSLRSQAGKYLAESSKQVIDQGDAIQERREP